MSNLIAIDTFINSLSAHIQGEMEAIVEEEAKLASERAYSRCRALAPQLAMTLFKEFDISRDHRGIVITVKNVEKHDGNR